MLRRRGGAWVERCAEGCTKIDGGISEDLQREEVMGIDLIFGGEEGLQRLWARRFWGRRHVLPGA